MWRVILVVVVALVVSGGAAAATLVDIALDQQIAIGLGDAITGQNGFGTDGGVGYTERRLATGNGAGEWWWGPNVNLPKAGYGPYMDLSKTGARIEYTARFFQGDGNTHPYADAPIFIELTDADGTACWMGISYGPVPAPHYPQWLTVTEDLSEASPELDLSRIVSITFFGTDWHGEGNDLVQIRDLKLMDDTARDSIPIPEAKNRADGTPVELSGTVSATLAGLGRFYIQSPANFCGIQVRADDLPNQGSAVYVKGTVQTDPDSGEMYVDADSVDSCGGGVSRPRYMNSIALGGASVNRQVGINMPRGPNNTGLLVKISGKLTAKASDSSWVCVSDGAQMTDSGNLGVRVSLAGLPFYKRPAINLGNCVTVTGISSLYVNNEGARRPMVLLRDGGWVDTQSNGNEPKTIRVAVVNFDPYCPSHDNKRVHEVFYWHNPTSLAQSYVNDLSNTSAGWAKYQILDWFDADYFPHFVDGFQWNPDDYVVAWQTQVGLHGGHSDYLRILTDASYPHNQPKTLAQRVADDEIDEVFLFGAPAGLAGWEAAMAGPSPYFINGDSYSISTAPRNFVVMGFNYERDVDCMLENFLHRSECVMSRVYPSPDWWFPTFPAENNWDKFRMIDTLGYGESAVGTCHFAPNSESDYDWANPRYVWSTCDDWLYNWPNLQGEITKRWVNTEEWGGGDMRLHHVWWLNHFPKAPGINLDGRQNNWWKYTCDFNNYPESR